jgi:hypothetical protein
MGSGFEGAGNDDRNGQKRWDRNGDIHECHSDS